MKVVFVSGCYDILHGGHIEFFKQARSLGHRLVVSVATDRVIRGMKHREPAFPLEHRSAVLAALSDIDEVVVSDGDPMHLNFKDDFLRLQPDMLVVTDDDRFEAEKRELCSQIGAEYIKLNKTSVIEPVSSTSIVRQIEAPDETPMRVDFAGGWLDVPSLARTGGRIVNCTISPLATRRSSPSAMRAGLGGSAANSVLTGRDGIAAELAMGTGWQDIAVIVETGLCIWRSGKCPVLEAKIHPAMLSGIMALWWTGQHHDTPQLVALDRDYDMIVEAADLAASGALNQSIDELCQGINLSYRVQRQEGMDELSTGAEIAKKYCGSGWGGYALYVFSNHSDRDVFVANDVGCIAIEPYMRFA